MIKISGKDRQISEILSCLSCYLVVFFLGSALSLEAAAGASPQKLRALYGSLDKISITQQLALYQLYPDTPEGQRALGDALRLLGANPSQKRGVNTLVALINKRPSETLPELSNEDLALVDSLAAHLRNRSLKGRRALSEAEVLQLPPEQVDLARGLLLSELGNTPAALRQCRSYEAMLDLMALQLLARVGFEAPPKTKIRELNRLIFETMNYRFPPKSWYKTDIHRYTFLPSVLDTRRGVCLGVSLLYAALAQRLGLPLELVTPPGHIFVRYREGDDEINIETTLRGVHIDSDDYLNVETRKLQQRNIKETIGLAHINEASVYFQEGDYPKALLSYQKAHPYLPEDPQLQELTGYTYLLIGDNDKAFELLRPLVDSDSTYTIGKNTLIEDLLSGKADARCVESVFQPCEETAEALMSKRYELEALLKERPDFRTGWLHLGSMLLSLGRFGEALEAIAHYHQLDDQNANAEAMLAELYAVRMDYPKAWEHLRQAEKILATYDHQPNCVDDLRRELALRCPE